jgi:hypothetical protein
MTQWALPWQKTNKLQICHHVSSWQLVTSINKHYIHAVTLSMDPRNLSFIQMCWSVSQMVCTHTCSLLSTHSFYIQQNSINPTSTGTNRWQIIEHSRLLNGTYNDLNSDRYIFFFFYCSYTLATQLSEVYSVGISSL